MKVTLISCFRNATAYTPRYFDQVGALAMLLSERGDFLNLILGYGDSTDGTGEMLYEEAHFFISALLVDVSHGGQHYGSIEHPERFKQLAKIGNTLLDLVPADADVAGFVESDLVWDAKTLLRLIDDLEHLPPPYAAIAPMVMDGQHSFYDVFAFRRGGERFSKLPPYHPDIDDGSDLVEVDSAGSVLLMDGELARKVRLTDGEAIVGLCEEIRKAGASIWLDTQAAVAHPKDGRVWQHFGRDARDPRDLRIQGDRAIRV